MVLEFIKKRLAPPALTLALILPLVSQASGDIPAGDVENVPGSSGDWWKQVQRELAKAEYVAKPNDHGLQAPNRAHNLRTYFEPRGIRLHSRIGLESGELLGLSLSAMGRASTLTCVEEGKVTPTGSRVEIVRPGLVEWYENSRRGLEQGFTIRKRPGGCGPLTLELAVTGARATPRGESAVLVSNAGRNLRYGKPKAWDASKRPLQSRLEVSGPHSMQLVIDDAGAVYPVVIDPLITGMPDFMLESNQPDPSGFKPAAFGGGVASAGDVNGDGFDDVIVGAPGWDGGDPHEGAAFVFLGSAAGISGSDPTTAHAWLESNQAFAQFGTVSGAGDVNGDGFDDIIVGAHFYDDLFPGDSTLSVDGAAFVFLGSAAGITGTDPTNADAWIRPNQLNSDLGITVAGAGDINNDGFDDILVGVPKQGSPTFPPNIPPNENQGDGGAVLVFLGSAAGITGTGFSDADFELRPYPPGSPTPTQSFMGSHLGSAGDVNNDGFDDIITRSAGEALVFLGSASGLVGTDPTTAHARITPDAAGVGAVSGAGDVNGDGFDDIIVGVPGYPVKNSTTEEGAAFVFLGSASGITATSTLQAHAGFVGNLLAEWVGADVSGAGDVNGDGYDDVLVGAREYPGSLTSEGVAYLFRGSPSGITAQTLLDADVRIEAIQSGAVVLSSQTAFSVAGAGDINGDGFNDVIMGKGFWDNGEENEGAAFIYLGEAWPANPNQPPVAFAGVDQVHQDLDDNGSEVVTLTGSGFDPDGTILSYEWFEDETLLGTGPTTPATLSTSGDHTVVLVVTDNDGVRRGDPVTVRVELADNELVFFDDFSGGLGSWQTEGDVALISEGSFPSPPQVQIGITGAFLRRAVSLPAGATGMTVSFWGKASGLSASDELRVRVSTDGGPFTTIHTVTSADSDGSFRFYGGSTIPIGHSWFPEVAANLTLEFESDMVSGSFVVDDVVTRAIQANLSPISDAGPDQSVSDTDDDGVESVTLNGSGSYDPDGTIVSHEWREGVTLLGYGPSLGVSFERGSHEVTLTVTDDLGAVGSETAMVNVSSTVGVPDSPTPRTLSVHPAHPNPFRASTTIGFDLPAASKVTLRIYDVAGRQVRVLLDSEHVEAGRRVAVWDGKDQTGRAVASGLYLYRLEAGTAARTSRVIYLN